MMIHCGNVKDAPAFEHSTELFINAISAVVVKENAPYTVLHERFGRRIIGYCYDWQRKNKHRIFLILESETEDVSVRLKIASRAFLVHWLKQ